MPDLAAAIRRGDRRALARGITLVESTRADHRLQAEALLSALLPDTGEAIRVGISGVPGVGKSTFIETFGLHVIGQGHRVAVLAIDPSSQRTGGSILGDKTRMPELTRREEAFIRPSPAGATLGGVARRTREAMLLCEAAGFDVVVVETVGVGQSETMAADMVDLFLLLLLPNAGDELQGIKKGIVELADLVVVNKVDTDLKAAGRTAAEYKHALRLLHPATDRWEVPVMMASALTGQGVADVWSTIAGYRDRFGADGTLAARRRGQATSWLWSEIGESLMESFRRHPAVRDRVDLAVREVADGRVAPSAAARELLNSFFTGMAQGAVPDKKGS